MSTRLNNRFSEKRCDLWPDKQTNILIDYFKGREDLYNELHPNYFKKNYRDHAMKELWKLLGEEFSIREISEKLRRLRTLYRREKKNLEREGICSLEEQVKKCEWSLFSRLTFLNDSINREKAYDPPDSELQESTYIDRTSVSNDIEHHSVSNDIEHLSVSNDIEHHSVSNDIEHPSVSNDIAHPSVSNNIEHASVSNDTHSPPSVSSLRIDSGLDIESDAERIAPRKYSIKANSEATSKVKRLKRKENDESFINCNERNVSQSCSKQAMIDESVGHFSMFVRSQLKAIEDSKERNIAMLEITQILTNHLCPNFTFVTQVNE